MWPKEIPAAISASLTVLLVGLSFGWPSHAIPKLQSNESPVHLSDSEGSWLITTGFLCGIFAFPVATSLFNTIGRKATLLLTSIPYLLGWTTIVYFNHYKICIFVGKGLLGFADSMVFVTIPFYLAEISRTSTRGAVSSLFSIMYNIGALISYCSGPFLPFQLFPIIPLIVIPIFIITFLFMPETPHYFLLKNDHLSAVGVLKRLRNENSGGPYEIDDEIKIIKSAISEDLYSDMSICELFRNRSNRKAFMIVCMMVTFEQFSGITAILFYCQKLFKNSDSPFSPEVSAIIYACVFLFGSFLTGFSVDKVGRKPLALLSCIGCAICLTLQGIYFLLKVENIVNFSNYSWVILALVIPYVLFTVIGLVNIPMILMGELFHAKFKAVGAVAFGIYISIAIILATKFFQYASDEIAVYVPFFVFAINCIIGAMFVIKYMPETKNKSLAQIQIELQGIPLKTKDNATLNFLD